MQDQIDNSQVIHEKNNVSDSKIANGNGSVNFEGPAFVVEIEALNNIAARIEVAIERKMNLLKQRTNACNEAITELDGYISSIARILK